MVAVPERLEMELANRRYKMSIVGSLPRKWSMR